MNEPELTIGWSVLGSRAASIRYPEHRPDLEFLVVAQGDLPVDTTPPEQVRWLHLGSTGVAKSRNAVLSHARGEVLLFADDDVEVQMDGVEQALAAFRADPDLALVLGTAVDEHGRQRKRYATAAVELTRWNSAKAATYEMLVRPAAFRSAGVRFDECFGAGAELYLGDEYVLIADALAAGLRCRFLPVVLAVHPTDSSGSRFGTTADAVARSAVFDRVFGQLAPVARLGFLLRSPRRFGSAALAARFILGRVSVETRRMPEISARRQGGRGAGRTGSRPPS